MRNICPECGSPKISRQLRETMCKDCGFILSDEIFITG